MRKTLLPGFTIFLTIMLGQAANAASETILQYISACKTQLGIASNVTVPAVSCDDGFLFAPPSIASDPTNDFVGHKSITDTVDMVFACRWLRTDVEDNVRKAVSIEMLLNNRQTGNTCFFSAKSYPDTDLPQIPLSKATLVSITDSNTSNITNFWEAPADLNASSKKCVNCHIAGPYIASPRITSFLAQFGLLNNGHDTLPFTINNGNAVLNQTVRYHAVVTPLAYPNVSAFNTWDTDARSYISDFNVVTSDSSSALNDPQYQPNGCSSACHSIGAAPPSSNDLRIAGQTLIPSILSDLKSVIDQGVMPPYDDSSDYRWINLDSPGDGVESENFTSAKTATGTAIPSILANCVEPTIVEAHVADSNNVFMTTQQSNLGLLPDKLSVFNAKDGLVCLNSDQPAGHQCQDYKIRYECSDSSGHKSWTSWYNMDSPNGDGDHEERSRDANVCTSPAGLKVTGIEASATASNGWNYNSYGPTDRLAQFTPHGLTCNASDQPDHQCANYVVRYSSCITPSTIHLTSVYTGKQLTATGSSNNALTKGQPANSGWNTQQWTIEPVANTEYVRLRNIGTNTYLNVTTQSDSATVVTYALNTGCASEEWIIEPVTGSNDFRFRNVWSGKYLTIADTSNYSAIYSQSLNTGWTSQRWLLQ